MTSFPLTKGMELFYVHVAISAHAEHLSRSRGFFDRQVVERVLLAHVPLPGKLPSLLLEKHRAGIGNRVCRMPHPADLSRPVMGLAVENALQAGLHLS